MFATKAMIALTTIASLAAAGSANAGEFQSNGRTTAVRYHDIDLTNAVGQKGIAAPHPGRIEPRVRQQRPVADASLQQKALEHVEAPVASAIARAANGERYADAQLHAGKIAIE